MKKTFDISLAAQRFVLEEDAYKELADYLENLREYFKTDPEVLSDIEQAWAEKFQTKLKLNPHQEVITLADITALMAVMGTREDFARDLGVEQDLLDSSSSDNFISSEKNEDKEDKKVARRFYRDTEKAWLGGVASGLSNYFNVQVGFFRLFFVVFSFYFGVTIFLYILLWIFIPAAKTYAEKLAMNGYVANLDNIKNALEQARKYRPSVSRGLVEAVFKMFTRFWQLIRRAFGAGLILLAIFLIAGTLVSVFLAILYREADILIDFVPVRDLFALLPFGVFMWAGLLFGLGLALAVWQVGLIWFRQVANGFNFKLFTGFILMVLFGGSLFTALSLRYVPEVINYQKNFPGNTYEVMKVDISDIDIIQLGEGFDWWQVYFDSSVTEVEVEGRERDLKYFETVREGNKLFFNQNQNYETEGRGNDCWGICVYGHRRLIIRVPVSDMKTLTVLNANGQEIQKRGDFYNHFNLDEFDGFEEEDNEEVFEFEEEGV